MPKSCFGIVLKAERDIRTHPEFYATAVKRWNTESGKAASRNYHARSLRQYKLHGMPARQLKQFDADLVRPFLNRAARAGEFLWSSCDDFDETRLSVTDATMMLLVAVLLMRPEFDGRPYGIDDPPDGSGDGEYATVMEYTVVVPAAWQIVQATRPAVTSNTKTLSKTNARCRPGDLPDLNDTERNILEAIGSATLRGETVATKAGYPFNSNFKATLASMRKRGILRNHGSGYFMSES